MKPFAFLASALILCATPVLAAQPSPACEAKRARIETQMSEASARGRTHELAGLQKALRANKAHCTDQGLAQEREAQIRQAQKKVQAREKSLHEAHEKGDAKKIADRQEKLDEARRDLAEAQKPLLP